MNHVYDLLGDGKKAFFELSRTDRFMHAFWLLGPFFLLIERTPGDVYVSIVALTFLVRSLITRDGAWLKFFWVKSVFIFWGICLLSAIMSQAPSYAFGEALIWIRFPLFAMATAFWLGVDKRLLLLMFFSTASAILLMCGILAAELAIEGFKSRLSWPYDDLVPGNYLAKVGLPVVVFSTTLFLSLKGTKSILSGGFCLLAIGMTMMTGERVNFLIVLCAALLAVFVWEASWIKRFSYMILVSVIPISVLAIFPSVFDRFLVSFLDQLPLYKGSPYYDAMAPAWLIFEKFPTLGIGAGNFRYLCAELIQPGLGYHCHNHPHNFYLQILSETGLLGLILAAIFIASIIVKCFSARTINRHVLYSVAWIIPFALFWPIRSSADFFGQWNNIFLWSAVALALAVVHSKSKNI
ncbi:O-antigen ligase family protein [Candidatus Ponderosibacter sp. Uisw_141_02]|jgi:O-antigen ligase|uniref:O-antigen ligase family protein n=1 Tax=Candidatus Ponderosibacter sp. Uisw_141_02 TaxID=3231000 RepID=UPI003D477389